MKADAPLLETRSSLIHRLKATINGESWQDFFNTYSRHIRKRMCKSLLRDLTGTSLRVALFRALPLKFQLSCPGFARAFLVTGAPNLQNLGSVDIEKIT